MMHLCRELFSTILDMRECLLSNLLLKSFYPNKFLYDDIIKEDAVLEFKDFIYNLVDVENKREKEIIKTPEELLDEVGYKLYECNSESDIQAFKKYYSKGEELCTFNGDRLDKCYVFFALKKDVDKINRSDFKNPQRQDLYGTSVISIQFTKDKSHTLSIKNRYNHKVNNPDATFSNNLDNINEGLTESFEKYYGMRQMNGKQRFELEDYVKANNGKYYKYNYEIYNIYYCLDNIIIDNFKPITKYNEQKERYLVIDYFILDLTEKKIITYNNLKDSFIDSIGQIKNIYIKNDITGKTITIIPINGEDIVIKLDERNRIMELDNKNVLKINDYFLCHNWWLKALNLPKIQTIGNNFLYANIALSSLNLPNVQEIGNNFLYVNISLKSLNLPKVQTIEDKFLSINDSLEVINLPKLQTIGDDFLLRNEILREQIINKKINNLGRQLVKK